MTFGTTNTSTRLNLKTTYFLFFAAAFLFGCADDQVPGACDWEKFEFRATVDTITVKNAEEGDYVNYSVHLSFDKSGLSNETQYLEEIKNVPITKEILEKHRIKQGNVYSGEVHEVTNGNCPSPVVSFDQNFNF